jgi:hypothetical protein
MTRVLTALLSLALLGLGIVAAGGAVVEDKDRFGNVDGRGALTDKAALLKLSAADVIQLRGATGYVICPGSLAGNGIVASAALVESAQVIVTVGHALVDEAGRARAPLGDCLFRNQATPPVEMRLAGPDAVWIGLAGPAKAHDPRDYAVALLARPVPGAEPLRLASKTLPAGARVIGIVAWQEIAGKPLDPDMPVVQDCAVRELDPAEGTLPTNYLTDCDLGPVGSGGHIVSRTGGQWVTHGVFSSSGGALSVGRSYSRRLGSYTRAIGVDAGVAEAIEKALHSLRP